MSVLTNDDVIGEFCTWVEGGFLNAQQLQRIVDSAEHALDVMAMVPEQVPRLERRCPYVFTPSPLIDLTRPDVIDLTR